MSCYLLSTGRLHKKTRKSRLKHFPAGYVGNFYRNLADNVDNFLGSKEELQMISLFIWKMSKNTSLPQVISLRECKQALATM